MPGRRPVSVKGIQAALTRRSDPPVTEFAPLSPRDKGADDPVPKFQKKCRIELLQWWGFGHLRDRVVPIIYFPNAPTPRWEPHGNRQHSHEFRTRAP
jgi:hypothetical protein